MTLINLSNANKKYININFIDLKNTKKYFLEILNIEKYTKIDIIYYGNTIITKKIIRYYNDGDQLINFQKFSDIRRVRRENSIFR